MTEFKLDTRLETSSVFIADLKLCHVRLSTNGAFPWIMLMPRVPDIVEILDLSGEDQDRLWDEILFASNIMKKIYKPKKLNVANLGNVVPQLHVHVVARYEEDKAWPGPIWNSGVKEEYDAAELEKMIKQLQAAFSL